MKKIHIIILSITILLSFNVYKIDGKAKTNYNNKYLEDICEIVEGGTIKINNKVNSLFIVFEDQELAMKMLKKKIPILIMELSRYGNLADLNSNNWIEYRNIFYEYLNNDQNCENYEVDILILDCFFDIYENEYINNEILQTVKLYDSLTVNNNLSLYLSQLLPNNNSLIESITSNSTNYVGTFNKTAAITYAINYATTMNTSSYRYLGINHDCANFVSQIFEASGIQQTGGTNVDYGWWHKYANGTHSYSKAWIYADTLADYFNVVYSTTYIYNFTKKIEPGDAIVLDSANDGSWDHAGFVVDKGSTVTNGYVDCKIAQHSTNYLKWISESGNRWENYSGVGLYGKIRA